MTCNDMDAVLNSRSRVSDLPPEAAGQLAECERCRELIRVLDESSEMPAPSANGVKLIQESMLQNLKPVRSFAAATVSLAGFAISFLVVALVGSVQLHAYGGWSVLSLSQKGVVFTRPTIWRGCAGRLHVPPDEVA